MRLPSIKRIGMIPNLNTGDARRIRAWLEYAEGLRVESVQNAGGDYILRQAWPESLTPVVDSWFQRCHNRPTRREVAHAMIAAILECDWDVFQPQGEWTSYSEGPSWEAVNLGDSYITTLIYRNGRYSIGAWGDLPEVNS